MLSLNLSGLFFIISNGKLCLNCGVILFSVFQRKSVNLWVVNVVFPHLMIHEQAYATCKTEPKRKGHVSHVKQLSRPEVVNFGKEAVVDSKTCKNAKAGKEALIRDCTLNADSIFVVFL